MSRIGRRPVEIPEGVSVSLSGAEAVAVSGPLGKLEMPLPVGVGIDIDGAVANVKAPAERDRSNRGYQGLARALLANMVQGVSKGYERKLEINGVGYRAELSGRTVTMTLGFSHTKSLELPGGIEAIIDKSQTKVTIKGIDKQLVGQVAARLRSFKVPEPYKAKGVKYAGETIRRKAGKTGAK